MWSNHNVFLSRPAIVSQVPIQFSSLTNLQFIGLSLSLLLFFPVGLQTCVRSDMWKCLNELRWSCAIGSHSIYTGMTVTSGWDKCCAGSCAWWCSQLLGEFLKNEILFDFSVFYWWWWEHRLGHLAVYQIQSSNVDNYIFYFWKTPATQNWKPLLVVGARQLLLGRSFTNRRENMWEDKFLC